MSISIAIEHQFEAAHRLPHLAGKCVNLHGHSWSTTITVSAPALTEGCTVVEFGALKSAVRSWIDSHLDHATMLAAQDPLAPLLAANGCKLLRFGHNNEQLAADLAWPTVEAVATLLARVSGHALGQLATAPYARISRVDVRETRLNTATYEPPRTP